MAALVPHEEELMETDAADVSVQEQLASGEGAKSGSSLKITVKCQTLEGLEKLWSDYCSGHLTSVAQEYLVTDDIKEKLGVESLKLKTVITKEDYLKCKQYLLNKAANSTGLSSSPVSSTENLPEDKGATSLRKSDNDGNDEDCFEQSVGQDEEKMI